ncbi:MAG: V-type ATP synthase subunit F [Clostridia bacterium]|nr:V-type ATP synthase subunit F [Clostridia bacterium]
MKFFVISDNIDTVTGMRLAGIDGVVVHSPNAVRSRIEQAAQDESIGILLITERLVPMCPELIYDIKLNRRRPLIVEIPDRHSAGRSKDSIKKYVRDAIGVKV